ncbi:MAG: glycosyltransferase family 4 protein, partial [Acidimicrobiales bacterium]
MSRCAFLSFRLGQADGVSIVADSWSRALTNIGFDIVTVAGEGPVDRIVPGLAIDAVEPPSVGEVELALADVDLVVVENLLSIPLNLGASRVVATALADRPALLHHHDPPWQRDRFEHITELPPDDHAWRHVAINMLTKGQMADRGIEATVIYNGFDTSPALADRTRSRDALEVADDELLIAHPVRAIERKNISRAIQIASDLGGTYWLLGKAEDGYDDELATLLANASCRVIQASTPTRSEIYAAADFVVFPSKWEGFGNPPIEAAIYRKPVAVGTYPVASELRALGFDWFDPSDIDGMRSSIERPNLEMLDRNYRLASEHLSHDVM